MLPSSFNLLDWVTTKPVQVVNMNIKAFNGNIWDFPGGRGFRLRFPVHVAGIQIPGQGAKVT